MDLSAFGSPEDFKWGIANVPGFLDMAASYGISYSDILNYIGASEPVQPTPEPTPPPPPPPVYEPPVVTPPVYEPPVYQPPVYEPPVYEQPVYEPPPRQPYNGYDFNSVVNQTQVRANEGFALQDLYNYAVNVLGFTDQEAQNTLANVNFPIVQPVEPPPAPPPPPPPPEPVAPPPPALPPSPPEPPQRQAYNGLNFNDIVSQTQARANQGFSLSQLYEYATNTLGFTPEETNNVLASVSFPPPVVTPPPTPVVTLPPEPLVVTPPPPTPTPPPPTPEPPVVTPPVTEAQTTNAATPSTGGSMTTTVSPNYRPYTQENLVSDLFAGRERMDPLAAQQVSDAMQFLSMSGGGLDYWTTLLQHLGSYADQLGATPGSYQASRFDDAQEAVKEFYLAKDIAQGRINSTQANAILQAYNTQQDLESKQRILQNDKSYLAAIESNPSLIQGGMTPEYMRQTIARQEAYIQQLQGVVNNAKEMFKDVSPSSLEFTQAMGPTSYSYQNSGDYNFDTGAYEAGSTDPRDIPDFLGGNQQTTANANISTADASSVFQSVFGRAPNQQELANFASIAANDPRLASRSAFETYLKSTPDYTSYLNSLIAPTKPITPTPPPTTPPPPPAAPTTTITPTSVLSISDASFIFNSLFGRQPNASELANFQAAVAAKDPNLASVSSFTQYLMGTDAYKNLINRPTPTTLTTTKLTDAQAKSIFANLFGRQPNSTELANFIAAQSGSTPFTTQQGLESYLRGTPEYATYLQSLQRNATAGFKSVPQTFGGAFSVPVTPMAGPPYFEVGGAPIMEQSSIAGPEIRRRTQQRLGEGFTQQQLTNYALSQGISPDVIRYAFGEDVALPTTIQTGLTPAFKSGAAAFTSMRPSSLEFGAPAVSQAVKQYTPAAFDLSSLQSQYEQATGQKYGGEALDQTQQTGSWDGGKVTKDKIAYEKGGKVRGLLGPNPDNPDDGYGSLQVGEYVIRKKAVNKYGEDFLEALNESRLPKKKAKSLL